jgi:uncharacterized protein YcfJ
MPTSAAASAKSVRLGGLAGLGVASLIGGGTGHDVAMVLGTLGGAIIGDEVPWEMSDPIADASPHSSA